MPSPSPAISPYAGLSPSVADLVVVDGVVRYRDETQRRRKVAICGSGGVRQMPWEDPTYECWSLNNFWQTSRDRAGRIAASRWFEQHQIVPDVTGPRAGQIIQNAHDMQWIRECPVPLYTTEPFPENPRAVVWPVAAMARKYRHYFTCTFAYQICQAIDEGFEEIRVCGLELVLGSKREATVEAACVAYWLGLAEGRGIRLDITRSLAHNLDAKGYPDPQFLLYHPFHYGHDYWREADFTKQLVEHWDAKPTAV